MNDGAEAMRSGDFTPLTVRQVRTWAAIEAVGADTSSVLASAAFTRCADEIERLQDQLADLKQRLERASDDLAHREGNAKELDTVLRLRGKRQGVDLALSYLREYL